MCVTFQDFDKPHKERPDIGVLITQLDRGIFVTKQNIHPAARHMHAEIDARRSDFFHGKMEQRFEESQGLQQNYVL